MKRIPFLLLSAALLASCVITTPGAATISELMAHFIAQYGAPTGNGPVPPIQYLQPSNPNGPQVWTWFPVESTKTLTVTAVYWRADFSESFAWKAVWKIE